MASWFNKGDKHVDKDDEEDADEQVKDLKAKVKALEEELETWRIMHAQEVVFMREIILKLIDKPTGSSLPARPYSSLSPKDENRLAKGLVDGKDSKIDLKAGPIGKLP